MSRRSWPRAGALTAVLVVLLSAGGSALAPSWERDPLEVSYEGLPPVGAEPVPTAAADSLRYTDYEVAVDGATLPATVVAPPDAGPHPALVFVHGGGAGTRADYLDRAERMARRGVVSLVYDKRDVGYTLLQRDYRQLAADALAMVDTARAHPGVDAGQVGLWGTSEGGWVVPLAASRSRTVAYVALANAPTMMPGEQLSWAIDDGLQSQGAPAGARRLVSRAMALGDLGYVRHDPEPSWAGVGQPVLAYHSEAHPGIPPVESARILAGTLDRAGNRDYTIRFLGADGAPRDGGGAPLAWPDLMASWIHGLPDVPPQRVAGDDPAQRYRAVPQPDGLLTGPVVTLLMGLVAAGYLIGPVSRLIARWRARRGPTPPSGMRRRLRWMVGLGIGTIVGINLAIGALVAVSVLGGAAVVAPTVWVLLRLAALGTVAAAAAVTVGLVDAWRGGWRPAAVDRVWLAGAGIATVVVLLLAGYWELFALGW